MMPKIRDKNVEVYSEEVQEIMGHIPLWIVRWGITVFFLIFSSLMAGCYFFKYPVVVSTPFVLTTINPPAPLICKSSGRIGKWFVNEGQTVNQGEVIAILENAARYEDITTLYSFMNSLTGNWTKEVKQTDLPKELFLGKLQSAYITFQKPYRNLMHYLQQDLIGKQRALLENRIVNEQLQYGFLLRQWELKRQEDDLAQSIYSRDSAAYFKGGYGIIKTDYERSLQTFLNQKSSMLSFEAKIKDTEVSLLQLKENLLELRLTHQSELNNFQNILDEAAISLKTKVDDWIESYVLKSPIEGKITFTKFWSENQVVIVGERLATIVPSQETIIIARAFVPSSGLGKVEAGQKVNIKLTGFPYLEYGVLTGQVNSISLVPEERGYVTEIELSDGMRSSYSENLKFVQEMDGTADIITEETRLIYRFINPLKMIVNN